MIQYFSRTLRPALSSLLILLWLPACTWVEVDEHGYDVQALNAGAPPPSQCVSKGQVEVSVLHEISFYQRDEEKIAAELLKLARNEAGRMGANLIQPVQQPSEGRQRFDVYTCP
ncbi:MAG: DUF4156 domain-containing protein [Wenzhouxiangellaceae bacterium]